MHTRVYTHVYKDYNYAYHTMFACADVGRCVCACVYVNICICMCVCGCIHTFVRVINVCECVCVYIHMYVNTHI